MVSWKTLILWVTVGFLVLVALNAIALFVLGGPVAEMCGGGSDSSGEISTECHTDVSWRLLIGLTTVLLGSIALLAFAIPALRRSRRDDRVRAR